MRNILVIDDQPYKVEQYHNLDKSLYNVEFAETYREAILLLVQDKPNFFDEIILDYNLDEDFKGTDVLSYIAFECSLDGLLKEGFCIKPNSSEDHTNQILIDCIQKEELILSNNTYI